MGVLDKNSTPIVFFIQRQNALDPKHLQKLLKRKSIRTTEIRTHVSTKNLQLIKSAFAELWFFRNI